MARYVDADAMRERLLERGLKVDERIIQILYKTAIELLDIQPSADVRPERHGEWFHIGGDEWGCSCCGFVISTESSREHPMSEGLCNDYCCHCGAKMSREGEANGSKG